MSPLGPNPFYHSEYVHNTFILRGHHCQVGCGCAVVGCGQHWEWKHGIPPAYASVDNQLYWFGAYQGKIAGPLTKQESFRAN